MNGIDQRSTSPAGADSGDGSQRRPRHRGHSHAAMAIGSALLAAAATTTALWLAGSFDREVVQITEVVEIREFPEVPEPHETSPQLPDTTASSVTGPSPAPPDSTVATTVPVFAPTDLVAVVASRAIPSIVTVQSLDGGVRPGRIRKRGDNPLRWFHRHQPPRDRWRRHPQGDHVRRPLLTRLSWSAQTPSWTSPC